MSSFLWSIFNVTVLISILTYYLRTPLKEFVAARKVSIEKELSDVARDLSASRLGLSDVTKKLSELDVELSSLKKEAEEQGAKLKAQVIQDANRSSAQIISDAKAASKASVMDAKVEIIKGFVNEVVTMVQAEVTRDLNLDTKNIVRQQFSNSLEQSK